MPFANAEARGALCTKFGVNGIPNLVILDKNSNVITTEGVGSVHQDENCDMFPWRPPTFEELLNNNTKLIKGDKTPVSWDSAVEGKTIGMYFAAHSSDEEPPTSQLVEAYNAVQKAHPNKFEIIHVCLDKEEGSFDEVVSKMPWLSIPFSEGKLRKSLAGFFEVETIPCLVMVDTTNKKVTNAKALYDIQEDPSGLEFPWNPKPVQNLAHGIDGINEFPSVVAFLGGVDKDTRTKIRTDLTELAVKTQAQGKEIKFFYAENNEHPIVERICELAKVSDLTSARVIILNIQKKCSHTMEDKAVNGETLGKFVDGFFANTISTNNFGA
jgi:nucleoredoxin